MLQLKNANLRRGANLILEQANCVLHSGWKAGLVGRNGCGKSSLLSLVAGDLEPDQGAVELPADWRIASMAQEIPALPDPALQYVLDGHGQLREHEAALAAAQQAEDGNAIARAHEALDSIQAWSLPARAAAILAGLGFSEESQSAPVCSFSGGWRMRLNLARVLLADADLLLLDEPTNHLDLDAVIWLQDWLRNCRSTLLLISHDRDFLDGVVQHILHVAQGELTQYRGNYSDFERQRAANLARQQSIYQKQQAQAAHLQTFIDRFKAKATKARQAQSRIKALEKLELIAPAHVEDGFAIRFPDPLGLTDPLLDLDELSCGYGNQSILTGISLRIRPETRLGLIGPNGAGKSTLIRALAGELAPLEGTISAAPGLVIGYFHQQQIDALPQNETPLALMQRQQPQWEESRVRTELGCYGFTGDSVFLPVKQFSGGEKSRLALGLLIQTRPALLLLDEPANHLDLDMREALTLALQAYAGAVVLVSHDKHLLETTVDELMLVAQGRVQLWDGDLHDYASWLRQQRTSTHDTATQELATERSRAKIRRQDAAERRNRLRPLRQRLEKQESALEQCSEALATVTQSLTDEGLYHANRKDDLNQILQQQAFLKQQHSELEAQVLETMEALEDAERDLQAD